MSNKATSTFRTHSNYIKSFNLLVHDPAGSGELNLYEHVKSRFNNANAHSKSRSANLNLDQIKASLCSAWGTETLLLMTIKVINEDELIRLSNNWSAIQVYYIFYHCTQALHVAKGHPQRPDNHPTTQNLFYDYWAARPLCLSPWSFAYGNQAAINAPTGLSPDVSIHAWTACEGNAIHSLAFKALMTTRRETLNSKYKEQREMKRINNRRRWQAEEDARRARGLRGRRRPIFQLPRLTDAEKESINNSLRPFTIMDYFYRLRIKTNYEDSNMFSDGPEDIQVSRFIRNSLCKIAIGTLFIHELLIRNIVGRETFLQWTDEWIHRNIPHNLRLGLAARRRFLE